MFCENCGKEIKDENKFCPYCGASVQPEQNGEQPEQSAQPEQKSEQPEQSAQPEQKSEQPKQSAQSEQKSKQPKQYVQSEQRLTQKETTGNSSADVKNKGVSHPAPKKKKSSGSNWNYRDGSSHNNRNYCSSENVWKFRMTKETAKDRQYKRLKRNALKRIRSRRKRKM